MAEPMRNFEAYMAERITQYEPLDRSDEPDVPRLSKAEIAGFFAKEKAKFADRTPEQEKKSFEAFFERQNLQRERNTSGNLEALKSNPAFNGRSNSDMERLAVMRTALLESMDKKGFVPAVKDAMIEKFDKVYASPQALDKHDEALKPVAQEQRAEQELTH